MNATYRIPDEPRPGGLAELTVNPTWPLLAMMLGGSFIGIPWFILNGAAMGSPSRWREALVAALTPAFAVALAFVSFYWIGELGLPPRAVDYVFVLVTGVKLSAAYWLYTAQLRSFSIYEHFGGRVRHGMPIAVIAAFLRSKVILAAFGSSTWLGIVVM